MVHIYALSDGTDIFYIGKTKNLQHRISMHRLSSILLKDKKDKKIQEIIKSGRQFSVIKLDTCSENIALTLEAKYINEYSATYELLNICHNTHKNLSEIEKKMLVLISQDKDTKDMCKELFRSERTLEAIRQKLKEKANVKTIAGLVMWGIENGYITV